ncbi:MAG: hypothetical protein A2945_03560 [Candidatus Liptonbacteria bacterium RIFCSPLOWO2_01_FULL_52_25]|uniref:DUF4412 domain-containing protein n=1 Tax=Candidatus Liptonbacteria bacterium RIFCSPLOWO2_01_FULL_52_25 TaxID=1798650 RepID=A0A1G2CG90_9BACT|nr:MAG: hypothetical protein A2945_03560 [Candidatus Liptonbacteria bacterium RIFCSPLOWO2_01_FULL_52_25]
MQKLVGISLLALASLAAPSGQAREKPRWMREEPKNEYFSATYRLEGKTCFVNVHADGMGVTLVARTHLTDPRSPSLLTPRNDVLTIQQVDIRREGKFKTVIDRRSSAALEEIYDFDTNKIIVVRASYAEDKLAPHSFLTYSEAARMLPENVKALFLGEYGLGKPLPLKPSK